eukprot:Tbor_TRINITY_DN3634_c0_g1::TRINITY_DN3634_c0_g1_i1::g.293::m.293/K18726/FAF2, UBXD8; FAS-associated factor 2
MLTRCDLDRLCFKAIPKEIPFIETVTPSTLHIAASSSILEGTTSSSSTTKTPSYVRVLRAAAKEASSKGKYLLTYLHAEDHQGTPFFLEKVLSHPAVAQRLSEEYFLFVVDVPVVRGHSSKECDVTGTLGHDLAAKWGATSFPYCCVTIKMDSKFVGDIQGGFSAGDFLNFLGDCQKVANPIIYRDVAIIKERLEREQMRNLHGAQLEEAKRKDLEMLDKNERKKQQKLEEERLQREKEAARQQEMETVQREAERRRREVETLKKEAVSQLPDEPSEDEEKDKITTIRVMDFKGVPHERRFYRSDSLAVLYSFVISVPNYNGAAFKLVTGFPPKPLPSEAGDMPTIGECKPSLVPRCVVTMRDPSL